MEKVLFICIHNSARSQMAEAYLNDWGAGRFQAESAGLKPTEIHPLTIKVMAEEGYDLEGKKANSVFDLFQQGRLYSQVITVCEESVEQDCPVFPGVAYRAHWPFPDPAKPVGGPEEQLLRFRTIREQVKEQIKRFLNEQEMSA
jgi:arsenate reductase